MQDGLELRRLYAGITFSRLCPRLDMPCPYTSGSASPQALVMQEHAEVSGMQKLYKQKDLRRWFDSMNLRKMHCYAVCDCSLAALCCCCLLDDCCCDPTILLGQTYFQPQGFGQRNKDGVCLHDCEMKEEPALLQRLLLLLCIRVYCNLPFSMHTGVSKLERKHGRGIPAVDNILAMPRTGQNYSLLHVLGDGRIVGGLCIQGKVLMLHGLEFIYI